MDYVFRNYYHYHDKRRAKRLSELISEQQKEEEGKEKEK
jgi:hypothetical protein